jgi:AAA+ superfamily predicted ATPase
MELKFLDYFTPTEAGKKVSIRNIIVNEFQVDILLENTFVPENSNFKRFNQFFGLDNISGEIVENGLYYKLSLPRLELPTFNIPFIDFISNLEKNRSTSWTVGLNEFGPVEFNLSSFTHGLVYGSSGYGKSSFFRYLLTQTLSFHPDSINYIIDPKQVDYELYEDHKNVLKRASSYSEWMGILYSIMIEIELRKHYFTNGFDSPPQNLYEYNKLVSEYKRDDLPNFKQMFLWIDEAHLIVDGNGANYDECSAINCLGHIIRQARAFGIHIIISTQRVSDIPNSVRSQIPTIFSFFSAGSDVNLLNSKVELDKARPKAIPGRFTLLHGEELTSNIQAPFLGLEESIGASYILNQNEIVKDSKFCNGFLINNIDSTFFDKNYIIKLILGGVSLAEIKKSSANGVNTTGRESRVDLSFLKDIYFNGEDVSLKRNILMGSGSNEDLLSGFSAMLSDNNQKVSKKTDSVTGNSPNIELESITKSKNKLELKYIIEKYSKIYELQKRKGSFDYLLKDLSRNRGINLCYKSLLKHRKSLDIDDNRSPVKLDRVALTQKNKKLIESYISEIGIIKKTEKSGPLLIVHGGEGLGKRTIIEAISTSLGMPIREASRSDLLIDMQETPISESLRANVKLEDVEGVNSVDELVVFKDLDLAMTFIKKPKGNIHPVLLLEKNFGDYLSESFTGSNPVKEKIRYLNQFNIYLDIKKSDYSDENVLNLLVETLLQKYHFNFIENRKYGLDFAKKRVILIPEKIDSLIERAYFRAKNLDRDFDSVILKSILDDFDLTEQNSDHRAVDVIQPNIKMEDYKVSEDMKEKLNEAISFSRSVSATNYKFIENVRSMDRLVFLFSGPPGTGKSMGAEVLACELNKDLWICSLARLQSEFVGKTEQIMEDVFNSAQAAGAVLLIDECDSFLRSREQIKSDHMIKVVNNLLNLVANFKGILVLTTNYPEILDSAFSRRIDFKFNVQLPSFEARKEILKNLLLPDAPLADDVNISEAVKDIEISGGLLKVAVERAFMKMISQNKIEIDQRNLVDSLKVIVEENSFINKKIKKVGLSS